MVKVLAVEHSFEEHIGHGWGCGLLRVGAAAVAGRPGPGTATAGAGVPGWRVARVGPGRAADAGSGVLDLGVPAPLPCTLGLLLEGRISELQARAVTEASYVLPERVLPAFEDRVLKRAPEQTLTQLRDVVRRAQHRLDPAGAEQRKRRAQADRGVRVTDAGDGVVWLSALLAAEPAHACLQKIDAAARMAPKDDERTLQQRRADILVDAVLGGLSGELPAAHGRQPTISVIVSLETLAGVEDEPGWLDGYGPITADTARALGCNDDLGQ